MEQSGDVGIGTTNPSTLIHLSKGTTGSAGGGDAGITMTNKYDSPDNSWAITPQRSGVSNTGLEIRDVTDSRSVMSFDGSGYVGIGTPSPSAKLDVVTNDNVWVGEFTQSNTANGDGVIVTVGSTAAADYALSIRSNAGGTHVLAAKADGKVGIGTATTGGGRALTVAGGAITFSTPITGGTAVTQVVTGLPYTSKIHTLPVRTADDDSVFPLGRVRMVKAHLRFSETLAVQVGLETLNLEEVLFRTTQDLTGSVPPLFTGTKIMSLVGRTEEDESLRIISSGPLPLTLLNLITEHEVNIQ